MEIEAFPQAKFLPRPRGHDLPLNIEKNVATIKTSASWLKIHGLKARKLNLYQILAPNAYAPVEDFIPILQKTVQSTVHEVSVTFIFLLIKFFRLIFINKESYGSIYMA
jgi:hypothetical protein